MPDWASNASATCTVPLTDAWKMVSGIDWKGNVWASLLWEIAACSSASLWCPMLWPWEIMLWDGSYSGSIKMPDYHAGQCWLNGASSRKDRLCC